MARYTECPRCGNSEEHDAIFKCKNCGEIYCSECLPQNACRECGHEWGLLVTGIKLIAYLASDEDEDED